MNTFAFTLDLSKTAYMEPLRIRQGDHNGTTVQATILDHGVALDGSYTARFCMRHPGTGATYYRETGTYANGVATIALDEQYAASVPGRTTAYIQLLQGSTIIASTSDIPVVILHDATEDAVPGEVYDSAIEDALAELDEATGRISVMVQEQVAEELAAHPEWTTTVQDNSLPDSKLVQSGGILSRNQRLMYRLANLLTHRTDEGTLAAISDAAQTPMAGLSVYGQSTQDGTPTPESPVPIESVGGNLAVTPYTRFSYSTSRGVEYTQNADGSINAVGTATGGLAYLSLCNQTENTFGLERGETYTLVVSSENVTLLTLGGSGAAYKDAVVTIPESGNWTIGVGVLQNITVDETFRLSVFKGQHTHMTAVPYDCMGLWAQGRNVAAITNRPSVSNGVNITYNADSSVTLGGTATAQSVIWLNSQSLNLPAGTYTMSVSGLQSGVVVQFAHQMESGGAITYDYGSSSGPSATFTIPSGCYMNDFRFVISNGATVNTTVRIQIEVGSTAHDYQPYTETVTPIDLDGHELRSLPDGTRDELTVDAEGHAVLVQRVGSIVPTSENAAYSTSNPELGICIFRVPDQPALIPDGVSDNLRSSRFVPTTSGNASMPDGSMKLRKPTNSSGYAFIYYRNAAFTTVEQQKAWLDANPTEFLFPLATPVTHDLGYVDPVPLVGPDLTAQTVPTAPFVLDAERDLNVTLARLEAAIAALA